LPVKAGKRPAEPADKRMPRRAVRVKLGTIVA